MEKTKELKIIDVDKLIPYANNARTHSKEQITKLRGSLREFGFVAPVLIDKDYNIIAGHGRVSAAKEEGITEVPCVLVEHLSEAQKKVYILADNRLALDAGWDDEFLAINLDMIKEMGFDLAYTGFEAAEIDELFSRLHDVEVKDDEFDLENALKEASFAKRGDIWTVGRHRIMCGDATQKEDAALLMDGKKATSA